MTLMVQPGHTDPPRLGLKVAQHGVQVDELIEIWRLADQAGFDHLWTYDHLVSTVDETIPVLDGWTLLGAMARTTTSVRIGCMVTSAIYRHPAVVAKMAVTVDHLSQGRLDVGLGAGSSPDDQRILGFPALTLGERLDRLDEACTAIRALWTGEHVSFSGNHVRLSAALSRPRPKQRPAPPIWIGGRPGTRIVDIVARHANVWNLPHAEPQEITDLRLRLNAQCQRIGRYGEDIRLSVQVQYVTAATLAEVVRAYCEAGVDDITIKLRHESALRDAHDLAAALSSLRDIARASGPTVIGS